MNLYAVSVIVQNSNTQVIRNGVTAVIANNDDEAMGLGVKRFNDKEYRIADGWYNHQYITVQIDDDLIQEVTK